MFICAALNIIPADGAAICEHLWITILQNWNVGGNSEVVTHEGLTSF